MHLPYGVYRADHVGSFLRPKPLLAAREKLDAQPPISASELRKIEDEHIAKVVSSEIENGIRSVTDGEFRRAYFHIDFLQHLDGVERKGALSSTNVGKEGFTPPTLAVVGKLGHPKPIQVDDFKFIRSQIEKSGVDATAKVSIPSPYWL